MPAKRSGRKSKQPALTAERSEYLDDLKEQDAFSRGTLRTDSRRAAKRQRTARKPG